MLGPPTPPAAYPTGRPPHRLVILPRFPCGFPPGTVPRMRSLLRGIARLLSILGIILLFVAALLGGMLWLTLPRSNQTARIPGLSAPVDISFDADGIPRIRAANDLDAAAALGFVHARDRMFEMDLMRRNASGRLSELAGPVTLPLDRTMRVLGLRQAAESDYAALPADTRAILQAYANGVNAWIALRGRFAAPEFLLFGAPEPWTPVDSLLWGKTMGLWLSLNWRTELSRQALAGRVPQQMIDELWPDESGPGHPQALLTLPEQFADAAARPGSSAAQLSRRPSRCPTPPPTNGRWTAVIPPPARRCWPAIRIWRSASRRSGTWRGSTRRT